MSVHTVISNLSNSVGQEVILSGWVYQSRARDFEGDLPIYGDEKM